MKTDIERKNELLMATSLLVVDFVRPMAPASHPHR
jgi:hypothetical protein